MTEAATLSLSEKTMKPGQSAGEFDAVLAQGFKGLRFPAEMEASYLQAKAPERLGLIRMGAVLSIILSNTMLLTDWLMVPDQFDLALLLRLFIFTPLALAWLTCLTQIDRAAREWFGVTMSLVAAAITAYLSLFSTDELGPPYLVCLAMIVLFNGGVVRMPFWMAAQVDALIVVIFGITVYLMPNPPVAVMTSMTLVMVSTMVFTLYGSYWLEHEERSNWLMLQQEHCLLSEVEQGNQRLDELSRFDALTELANRRHFDEFLQQLWSRAQQNGDELALLMMDIDHFKRYNDHYGHPAGDACLKAVAGALRAHLRKPGDLVARLGGEEFIAVLSRTSLPLALAAAERVREGVAHLGIAHDAAPGFTTVTLSIGVATMVPGAPGSSPAALMAAADAALYRAKANGRNTVWSEAQGEA